MRNGTYSGWLVVLNKTVAQQHSVETTEILWNRKEISWRSPDAADIVTSARIAQQMTLVFVRSLLLLLLLLLLFIAYGVALAGVLYWYAMTLSPFNLQRQRRHLLTNATGQTDRQADKCRQTNRHKDTLIAKFFAHITGRSNHTKVVILQQRYSIR